MTDLLTRPDTRETAQYLLEENALLKDACIIERTRTRQTLKYIDDMTNLAKSAGHEDAVAALVRLKFLIEHPPQP